MGLFRRRGTRVVHVVVPQDRPCVDTVRISAAVVLVDAALAAQAVLHPDDRDQQLVDLALGVRHTLTQPPLPSRPQVPVNPGRAS
jgi:hypothetical protein